MEVRGSIPEHRLTRITLSEANFWDMKDLNRSFEEFGVAGCQSWRRWLQIMPV